MHSSKATRRLGRTSAAILTVALAACGAADATRDIAVVRDSAGITIVENEWRDSAGIAWWSIDATPLVDIGGEDAGEDYALFQVSAAARQSDGTIVVAHGGGADVRFYDAQGTHIRTVGRRGGGPGEYQRPGSIFVLPGDTLLVIDPFVRRISVLGPDGAFIREFASSPVTGGTGFFSPSMRFSDGTLAGTRSFSPDVNSDEVQRPELLLVTMAPSGTQDTVLTVPGSEMYIHIEGTPGGGANSIGSIAINRPPFRKSTSFALDEDAIYVGTQDAPEVGVYARDGTLRRIIRTGMVVRPVTEEDVDAWLEFELTDVDPARQESRRESLLSGGPGETVPPYGSLRTDLEGNLWIADYDARVEPRGRWTVYDGEGRAIARVQLPPELRIQEIGADYILGIQRDDLDVEHIVVYALQKT